MKKITYLLFFMLFATLSFAQQTIKGTITDAETKQPLPDALVKILGSKFSVRTDEKGQFRITKVPKGKKTIVISLKDHKTITQEIDSKEPLVKLGNIELGKPNAATDAIQTITLDEDDNADNTTDDQNVSSMLGTSRDLFQRYSNFNWNSVRYRTRGYLGNYNESYFNGIPFNDLDDERESFGAYAGLNEVTRKRTNYMGLEATDFAFGDLSGSSNIDTRASQQRKRSSISYQVSNRNTRNRIMGTYATGLQANGWAFTFSGSRRWAQEGYNPGTFMDAWAYFASVDKVFNDKHTLNLTILGSPNKQGGASATLKEMVELSGDPYYNNSWGYQNGKKRNARVTNRHAPTAILRHDFKINEKINLTTAASFQIESNTRQVVNFYNSRNPQPDYYSRLPSAIEDPIQKIQATNLLSTNEDERQLNWDYMYQTNYNSLQTIISDTPNGKVPTTGNRAKYFLTNIHQDSKEANIYSNIQMQVSEHQQIVGGIALRYFKGHDFAKISDLLGADFAVDVDQFAERNFPGQTFGQNDVRYSNRIVKVGDKASFEYNNNVRNAYAWAQSVWNLDKFDFFVSAKGDYTAFWRNGLTQNGRFPDNSLGKSATKSFFNYGVKAGATYKLDGRNYFGVHSGYFTKAPNSTDSYLSPRTRNEFAPNLASEKNISTEAFFNHRSPNFSAQITGYYTLIKNNTRTFSFFSDEDRSFVNYLAQGMDLRHTGVEAAASYKITNKFEVFGAATLSQHLYWSRPVAFATPDNGITSVQSKINGQTLYIKEYYVPNTPQTAASLGVKYNGKRFWTSLTGNYFAKRYMAMNFNRRTNSAVGGAIGSKTVVPDSKLWHEIIDQQKLEDVVTVNFIIGKSYRRGDYNWNFLLGIDNVLDALYVATAFEQWRFDDVEKNVNKFPPRYFYAMKRNFFVQTSLRF